ncbi:phosphoenolpyruvate--protein phosphotransferase [Sphingomonas abietis]|uniref:phosphoenolpyruvate--protein phosphotransferase n=1 Tax=Sphingomonas abietis TaxID=3012344 RepID=A0ABY7NKT8_9SPHN|nr:phosphoenolpyruvate--protein phosphotransferase [Sphingomonas abietis]WBO21857.1 phosphoenolpyruvate--protein phosphotransferase [Sphingomonas abietis]
MSVPIAGPIASPLAGWLTSLDAVPDPVFAERMLGDGVAIDPIEGIVRAPVAGRIVTLHPARHAVTIESDAGAVLLIHVGLETVALGGEGFVAHVAEGDRVAAGDRLLSFDLDAVGRRAKSLITPIVLTNGEAFAIVPAGLDRMIAIGEPLFGLVRRDAAVQAITDGPVAERALVLPLRHGLHARPAARVAERARDFAARVTIVAADGRTASALSPVAMLALALPHGAPLQLHGQGEDAEPAVAAIAALIESGMGEGLAIAPVAAAPETETVAAPLPDRLHGVAAAPGMAAGPAWTPVRVRFDVAERGRGIEQEREALAEALHILRADTLPEEGALASIAEAHRAFLDDPELLTSAARGIAAGQSAGFAWRQAVGHFVGLLGGTGDARFAERIDDLRDLEARVLTVLTGTPATVAPPAGAILVADELLPSQLMALADSGLAGIATGGGGPTSHVAIIAAGLGWPMLAALGADVARIADGTMLLLDAGTATLTIDPPADTLATSRIAADRAAAFRAEAVARAHDPAATRDGARIEIFANLGSLEEARAAAQAGAEGCGLLRTEFLFLDRPSPPDEEEQVATYQAIADALGGRPLIVRTLDIGADKPAPYWPMPPEENPALGLRGLRLGLARPALLETQLRALARVTGDVKIMLPMVIEPAEVRRVRAMLAAIADAPPALGIMVETPAAAMLADALAVDADFFSIGSNDLSQYALAMDRGNPAVAARLDALHPAVLRLIAATVAGGATRDRWTGVCGGMAADPLAVPILIGLGITELSVPPSAVAETKARVRRTSLASARDLAQAALAADGAAAVRALARTYIEDIGA